MAKALRLLASARRYREYAAATSAILAAWPELAAAWHARSQALRDRAATDANASSAHMDALSKVVMLEDALRRSIAQRDAADLRAAELEQAVAGLTLRIADADAWILLAKRVTEAAREWARSPMSDAARRQLSEATRALG